MEKFHTKYRTRTQAHDNEIGVLQKAKTSLRHFNTNGRKTRLGQPYQDLTLSRFTTRRISSPRHSNRQIRVVGVYATTTKTASPNEDYSHCAPSPGRQTAFQGLGRFPEVWSCRPCQTCSFLALPRRRLRPSPSAVCHDL